MHAVIIFVTNYIEYAPEGYEVQAFRYSLKCDIFDKLDSYLQLAIIKLHSSREKFKIQVNGEIIDIPVENILYIESQLHTVTIIVQKDKQRDMNTLSAPNNNAKCEEDER